MVMAQLLELLKLESSYVYTYVSISDENHEYITSRYDRERCRDEICFYSKCTRAIRHPPLIKCASRSTSDDESVVDICWNVEKLFMRNEGS
jgi:hypothetical protein